MANVTPDALAARVMQLCLLYLRAPSSFLTDNATGLPVLTFNPALSVGEQTTYNALLAMAQYEAGQTLASWQAGTWMPPANSSLAKLAPNINSDGSVKPAAIPVVQGPKGDPGIQGVQGIQGTSGAPGTNGTQGIQGVPGTAGTNGTNWVPVHTVLGNDTLALALGVNTSVRLTVTANRTLTTTVPPAGSTRVVLILTAGASSFTITFGTGFKPTGTLATGTTTARVFAISFLSDGTNLYETGRTIAMPA